MSASKTQLTRSFIRAVCRCIQRPMRVSPWPEAIAEPKKVDFVDGAQHLGNRTLDDLVFKCRNAEGPLPAVGFRDEGSAHRLWPVSPGVDPVAKVPDVGIQVPLVVRYRYPIHSSARCPPLPPERSIERIVVHVMQQRREAGLARSPRRLVHLDELGWQRSPALCPVSRRLAQVPLGSGPSLGLARYLRHRHQYYVPIRHPVRYSPQLRLSLATGSLRQPHRRPRRGFPGSDAFPSCVKWP